MIITINFTRATFEQVENTFFFPLDTLDDEDLKGLATRHPQ